MHPHPKFISRWADIYIAKSRQDGAKAARTWASNTVTPEHMHSLKRCIEQKLEAENNDKG